MTREERYISRINRPILLKTSIFTFFTLLIASGAILILFNIYLHSKLIDYTQNYFSGELSGIRKIMENTNDNKIVGEYIKAVSLNKPYFAGIITGGRILSGNNSFTAEKIKSLMSNEIKFNKDDSMKIKIFKLKTYIMNIYSNQYFISYVKYNDSIVFFIYKPVDIAKKFLFYINIFSMILIITGILTIVLIFTSYIKRVYVKPIKKLLKKSEMVKLGNLSIDFNNAGRRDEIGNLSLAFRESTETLKDLIENVYKAVMIMTRILNNLFKSSKSVSDSANAQVITVDETQGNFEKLNIMVKTITEESKRGSNYTMNAFDKTKIGLESIQNLESEMTKIESSSQEITDIIRIINDIAEQTELLSLNASIESARAGESGRGFSVVAGEVRKLAEKTSQAANRVYALITNNNNLIRAGVNYSKNATKILKEISMANELSASVAKTINDETQKIKQITNEMMGVINYIAEVAKANLLESDHVASTTGELSGQAVELQRFIEKFDIRSNQEKENQKRIEKILKNKLGEMTLYIKEKGNMFLPTGNHINIKSGNKIYNIEEIQLGTVNVTGNDSFVDDLKEKFDAQVLVYQNLDDSLFSVTTTLTNYDTTRLTGMFIDQDSKIYENLKSGKNYITRIFLLDRWYVIAFKPFIDQTGFMQCVIALSIPEEMEIKLETDKNLSKSAT